MPLSEPDRKRLWACSGNRCAFPECDRRLTGGINEYIAVADSHVTLTLGEEAHIVARSNNGPRADPSMPPQKRDSYENMILLCEEHHKVIDAANGMHFSVDELLAMKREHEEKVSQQVERTASRDKGATDRMARFIEAWEERVDLPNWNNWTAGLLQPTPVIDRDRFERFSETSLWLGTRTWNFATFLQIQRSAAIFTQIWRDFVHLVDETFAPHRIIRDRFCLHEKHKEIDWNPELYKQLGDEFDLNADLIQHTVYHLTAAANLMHDCICDELDPQYGFDKGYASLTRGLNMSLKFENLVPIYSAEQRALDHPYPGQEALRNSLKKTIKGERPY